MVLLGVSVASLAGRMTVYQFVVSCTLLGPERTIDAQQSDTCQLAMHGDAELVDFSVIRVCSLLPAEGMCYDLPAWSIS